MNRLLLILAGGLALSGSLCGMDKANFDKETAALRRRAENLQSSAEKLRRKDPDFAKWVTFQQETFKNFEKAAVFDFTYEQKRLPTTLSDWNYLLSRMEKECRAFSSMPYPSDFSEALNVRDFGAKGDGVTDDAPAIRKALEKANTGKIRRVFIPAGRYFLKALPGDPQLCIFDLKQYKNVFIGGEKGTVLITETARGPLFRLNECENVRISGFHKTSAKTFYTTGLITDIQAPNRIEVKIDDGCISPLDPMFKQSDGKGLLRFCSGEMTGNTNTPKYYGTPGSLPPYWNIRVSRKDGNSWIFEVPGKFDLEKTRRDMIGQRLIYFARDYRAAFDVQDSVRCRLENISLDSASGVTIGQKNNSAFFVVNFKTKAPENAKVAVATAADAILGLGASLGGYVADSSFQNHGDDFINIYSFVKPVLMQEKNVIYLPDELSADMLANLKRLDIIRHSKGVFYTNERYNVCSVTKVRKKQGPLCIDIKKSRPGDVKTVTAPETEITLLRVELDGEPEQLVTTQPFLDMRGIHVLRAYKKQKFDMVHFPDFESPGQVFANNRFADGFSRVLHIGSASLAVGNEFHNILPLFAFLRAAAWNDFISWWGESYYPRCITFKNNRIKTLDARLFNMAETRYNPQDRSTWAAHFFAEGNTVEFMRYAPDAGQPLFWIRGVDDAQILNNKIKADGPRGRRWILQNCRVKLDGNEIDSRFAPGEIHENVLLFK